MFTIGDRVQYRFWDSEDFHTGTIVRFWEGGYNGSYVDIKRDGYREVAVMPAHKMGNPNLVREV